jgi:Cdc6-like AAA superfamily ATPase
VLDEVGFLVKKDSDLIYSLTRINEINFSQQFYLSFIGIVKDILSLKNLDDATISSLQNEVIRFKKYSESQIFDILAERIKMGLKPGIVDESVLKLISTITSVSGDMRKSLKLLKDAVRYAEFHQMEKITLSVIQEVNSKTFSLTNNELYYLKRPELLLYASICNMLSNSQTEVTMNDIKQEYFAVCEYYSEKPRSDTQLWEYIQTLKRNDLITATIKNKNQRGRKSCFSIPNYSIPTIKREIEKILIMGNSHES